MITGVDHPAIAADNLEELTNWYCDTLGYEKFFKHPEKPVWIIKSPDGSFIEMMQKDDTTRPNRSVLTPGISHLAFRVKNLQEAIAMLEKKNVKWISEVVDAIGGGKLKSFEDPEGNMLQIVDRNA